MPKVSASVGGARGPLRRAGRAPSAMRLIVQSTNSPNHAVLATKPRPASYTVEIDRAYARTVGGQASGETVFTGVVRLCYKFLGDSS